MPAWSIDIVPGEGGNAVFTPNVPGFSPGEPLRAQVNDSVSWGNRTDQVHQLWPSTSDWQLDANAQGLCELIQPWTASTPAYLIADSANTTIYYVCLIHPDEHGEIQIVS